MPNRPTRRVAFSAAALAASAALGCRGAPTAPGYELAELLRAQVPATVAPGTAFEVAGDFGRGACDQTTPVVKQTADGVRLALARRLKPGTTACTDVLLSERVAARVGPAARRPFTVRLSRRGEPDSVVVVRAP